MRYQYNVEDLENAVKAVTTNQLSYRKAAEVFKVPRGTLVGRVKNKYAGKGKTTVLTADEEDMFANGLLDMSNSGFPATKLQLLDSVQLYLNKEERTTPFVENRPGRDWYERFMKRHPDLSLRIAQNLTKSRSNLSEAAIRSWFAEVSSLSCRIKTKNRNFS